MRKRWFLVALMVSVLAIGVTGATVFAQSSDGNGGGGVKGLVSRVAQILGLDDQQVQDAFDQARMEMRDDAIRTKLDRQVEAGRLTQEQADEYYDWYQDMPEGIDGLFGGRGFGKSGFGKAGFGRGHQFQGRQFQGRKHIRPFGGAEPAPTAEASSITF